MFRNIDACQQLSKMTKTALGPHGKCFALNSDFPSLLGNNKMVINHLDKLFKTSDAATIIKESDIAHPAAKMIAQAAKMQENECGDGTNFVITLAGELMLQAQGLLQMGLHPSEILVGYEKAAKKVHEELENQVCYKLEDPSNHEEMLKCMKSSIASKMYGNEDFLAGLITKAALSSIPKGGRKLVLDNIRVVKILGGGLFDSEVIRGMVIIRQSETSIHHA